MNLSEAEIDEFRRLLEQETGETVTLADAQEEASHLLDVLLLISRELPSEAAARLRQVERPEAPPTS